MKKINCIFLMFLLLIVIMGCDRDIEVIDCEVNPEYESCLEKPDKEKNENYKEIEIDEQKLIESYDMSWGGPNPLLGVFQFDFIEKTLLPEIIFSEISDKYIAIYVDSEYVEALNYELSIERAEQFNNDPNINDNKWNFYRVVNNYRKSFDELFYFTKETDVVYDTNITYVEVQKSYLVPNYHYQLYYDIVSNNKKEMYTYKNVEINRENFEVTYYEVDKNQEILLEKDDKTLIGLYGTREITCAHDYYEETNIGKKQIVYFSIPIFIKDSKVIVKEDIGYYDVPFMYEYNTLWRIAKTDAKYIYSYWGSKAFKNLGNLVQSSSNENGYYLMEVREIEDKEYLIVNGSIDGYLKAIQAGPKPIGFDEKLLNANNIELSLSVYYNEKILKPYHNYSEKDIEKEWNAYLIMVEKYGRSLEVYEYEEIKKMIEENC